MLAPLWSVSLGAAARVARDVLVGLGQDRPLWEILAELDATVVSSGPELGDEWTFDRALRDDRGIPRGACTSFRVLEHLPQDVPNEPVPPEDVDKIEWFTSRAQEELQQYAENSGAPADRANVVVTTDSPESEIIRFIRANDIDLVVVGAHERHGLALFQGRTADNLIHNAPCDVLVVHI